MQEIYYLDVYAFVFIMNTYHFSRPGFIISPSLFSFSSKSNFTFLNYQTLIQPLFPIPNSQISISILTMPPPPSPPPPIIIHNHHHHHHHHADPHSKPTSNLISFFLKPIIMLLLTSLFFLFLGFAAFLLLHLFLLGSALHRLRFRPNHPSHPSPNLNALPRFRVSRGSEPAPESRCVVCLDGFRNGQWCRKLSGCGHLFHRRCVDTWLVKVAACPTCRTPVRFDSDVPTTQDDRQFWNYATNTNALTMLL
ncbi:hypothetical protein RIF29_07457 [Crotalaria pallida]|uniref:RING-type domain-containing protein n=1 Tax=Crotalaria pallida TaxID=3830 RepID=A0AAN9J5B7_CROPI